MYMYTKCMQEINDLKLIIQHKPIFKLCIITCIFVVQKKCSPWFMCRPFNIRGDIPGTFTCLIIIWSLIPPDFKEC